MYRINIVRFLIWTLLAVLACSVNGYNTTKPCEKNKKNCNGTVVDQAPTTTTTTTTQAPTTTTTTTTPAPTTTTTTTTPAQDSDDEDENISTESSLITGYKSRDRTKDCDNIGVAVGLLFLGLAVGTITTCLLCIFVPTLHRKATSIMVRNGKSQSDEKKKETSSDPQVRPSALTRANDSRDSHIYNLIQHDTQLANPAKPVQAPQAISSPEYNILAADNIIKSSSPSTEQTYQSLEKRSLDTAEYNYGPLELSGNNTQNETRAEINMPANSATTADQNYFILKPGTEASSDMESGKQEVDDNSAHAYFVLEKKSGAPGGSSDLSDVTQPEPTHDYFVLERKT